MNGSNKTIVLAVLLAAMAFATPLTPSSTTYAADQFSFRVVAFLGDTAPGGPIGGEIPAYTFDFEPGDVNNRGQLVFGADLTTGGEGVFIAGPRRRRLSRLSTISAMARTGDTAPAPDEAILGPLFLGVVTINDRGEAAVAFHRDYLTFPTLLEVNSGLYRYTSAVRHLAVELLPGAPAPGGGTFHGFAFQPVINNQGTIAFGATIEATIGPGNPPGSETGLGLGMFTVDSSHNVSKVARPGDPAPDGETFDFVHIPWMNDLGDVAFTAHVQEDPCIQFPASFPTGNQIFCAESIYLQDHETGQIVPIARQGDAAPGGGEYTNAYGQKVNNSGQIAYIGTFPADPAGTGHLLPDNDGEVFFFENGTSRVIARPGDPMPGGGSFVTSGFFTADVGLNNNGVVSFDAVIDSDADGDGREDTALYTWEGGVLTRVVGSGDRIPGLGMVRALKPPDVLDLPFPFSGAPINDFGQIAFAAAVEDEQGVIRGVLLLATPR